MAVGGGAATGEGEGAWVVALVHASNVPNKLQRPARLRVSDGTHFIPLSSSNTTPTRAPSPDPSLMPEQPPSTQPASSEMTPEEISQYLSTHRVLH